jgi:hypothetical protein
MIYGKEYTRHLELATVNVTNGRRGSMEVGQTSTGFIKDQHLCSQSRSNDLLKPVEIH